MIELIVGENGKMPIYKTWGSAAADIYSAENTCIRPGDTEAISTDLFLSAHQEPSKTEHLEIRPRSGMASAGVVAHLGLIDADYPGEIKVILHNMSTKNFVIAKGDRIAQIMLCTHDKIEGTLQSKDRRFGGMGSTGK